MKQKLILIMNFKAVYLKDVKFIYVQLILQ